VCKRCERDVKDMEGLRSVIVTISLRGVHGIKVVLVCELVSLIVAL
jgi:hypothetical protein